VEDAAREALLRQATEVAIFDMGVIPLFFLQNTWASRTGVIRRLSLAAGAQVLGVMRRCLS
jgi:hypothetical protein